MINESVLDKEKQYVAAELKPDCAAEIQTSATGEIEEDSFDEYDLDESAQQAHDLDEEAQELLSIQDIVPARIKERGRPFRVGNTVGRGRPKGSRNRANSETPDHLAELAEMITLICINKALKGDHVAMRLCMERLHPVCRALPVNFDLPVVRDIQGLADAYNSVAQAVANGELTIVEGQQVVSILERVEHLLPRLQSKSQQPKRTPPDADFYANPSKEAFTELQ
jgi:hypothetical protein